MIFLLCQLSTRQFETLACTARIRWPCCDAPLRGLHEPHHTHEAKMFHWNTLILTTILELSVRIVFDAAQASRDSQHLLAIVYGLLSSGLRLGFSVDTSICSSSCLCCSMSNTISPFGICEIWRPRLQSQTLCALLS